MSSQFCNSGVLEIIGSTCSNETRTRVTILAFHLIFVEGFYERCCIPYVIYCMSIPSQLIVFIAQNIILFEHPIQISLWARMIRCDGKMKKIYVINFDLRRVFTALTWCMLCWCEWAIFLLRIDAESVWSSRFAVKSELVMILWNELAFFTKIIVSPKIWT